MKGMYTVTATVIAKRLLKRLCGGAGLPVVSDSKQISRWEKILFLVSISVDIRYSVIEL